MHHSTRVSKKKKEKKSHKYGSSVFIFFLLVGQQRSSCFVLFLLLLQKKKSSRTSSSDKLRLFQISPLRVNRCVYTWMKMVVVVLGVGGVNLGDWFQFVDNLLLLNASVLKPNCNLPFGQVGLGRYPPPFVLRDKFIGSVFPLQFLQLHLGVRDTLLPPTPVRAGVAASVGHRVCGGTRERQQVQQFV